MFNCHQQNLLTQYFLLTLQNLRLHQDLKQKTQLEGYISGDRNQHLIVQIESKMKSQINRKQQKITQQSLYIRQLHNLNEQLSLKLQTAQYKYRTLQENHLKQIREYKKKLIDNNSFAYLTQQKNNMIQNLALQSAKLDKRNNQEHNYHIRVLQRQKQQLNSQIERLTKVTIKQLQADIETLNRANQTYMNSITNYRSQENRYMSQRLKYEQKIAKYCEQISTYQTERGQKILEIQFLKNQNQSIKENLQKNEKFNRNQIENVSKINIQLTQQIKKMKQKLEQLQKLRQKYRICSQELQKKALKLKQYDDQYKLYVNKITLFSNQMGQLRQQNSKLRQYYENQLSQQKKKSNQARHKITEENKYFNQKVMNQFHQKVKIIQNQYNLQKIKEIKSLEGQIQCLKQQIQSGLKEQDEKYQRVQKQRDDALKQWDQIIVQMGKQKKIIKSLQQQIQTYRKNNSAKFIQTKYNTQPPKIQSDPYLDLMNKICQYKNQKTQLNKQSRKDSKQSLKSGYGIDFYSNVMQKSQIVSNQQVQSYRERKNNQNKDQIISIRLKTEENISNRDQIQSKRQDEGQLQNFSFSTHRNKYQPPSMKASSNGQNNCCQQCQISKKKGSMITQRHEKQNSTYKQIINQMNLDVQRDSRTTKREKETYQVQRTHIQGRLSLDTKYKSQQFQKPSLIHKKKQQSFKKYQNIRTKTQESFLQSGCSEKQFFKQNNVPSSKVDKFTKTNGYQSQKLDYDAYYRSLSYQKRQYSSTSVDNKVIREDQQIMRRSSLKKIDHDKKLEQIQQYLSFNVKDLKQQRAMKRSFSDRGLKQNVGVDVQRVKTYGRQNQKQEKQVLMEKINKISSWRGQNEPGKHTKWFNYHKKAAVPLGRMGRKAEKQNINDIIHKKCQYISEK